MSFFEELKRRNVYRMGVAYVVVSWIVLQVLDVLQDILELPDWAGKLVLVLLLIGLPIALVFAWVYELTPEGLKRESEVNRSESIRHETGKKLEYLTIGLLVIVGGLIIYDRFIATQTEPEITVESAIATDPAGVTGDSKPASQKESIAVLPFINMSSDPEQEYFSDGISEELLNLLTRIPQLKVIARTSSFYYKGKDVPLAQIAQELNVEHVLEGSVRKAGNQVRITAQLIRASDSSHLWSESYDRTLENIFAIQDEVAAAVVKQLQLALLGEAPKAQQVDLEAYALYLRARHAYSQFTRESLLRAVSLYEQALEIDPSYAAAWGGLAVARQNLATLEKEYVGTARQAINRSLKFDPNSAEAYSYSGLISMSDGEWEAAAKHLQKALELEPSNALALAHAAGLARNLRQYNSAISIAQQAISRDPLNWVAHFHLGSTYFLSGQMDESIRSIRNWLQLNPETIVAHTAIGLALLQKGDIDEALAEIEAEPYEGIRLFALAIVQYARGQTAESNVVLAELIEKHGETMPSHIAAALAYRGDIDRAFSWLEKAARIFDPALARLINPYAPMFDKLRDDPRWLPLLESIGMAPDQLAAIEFNVDLPE